jgi:hypothetical protein
LPGLLPHLHLPNDEKYSQLLTRLCAPFVRDLFKEFRAQAISAAEAASQLALITRRFYQLYADYLQAVAKRKADCWTPGLSGGNHRSAWPEEVRQLVIKLLKKRCSYSLIASEALRRFNHKVDRATIRRFALRNQLAAPQRSAPRKPVRRWQTQQIGQLWQYDASPHRWFCGQDWQPSLRQMTESSTTRVESRAIHVFRKGTQSETRGLLCLRLVCWQSSRQDFELMRHTWSNQNTPANRRGRSPFRRSGFIMPAFRRTVAFLAVAQRGR